MTYQPESQRSLTRDPPIPYSLEFLAATHDALGAPLFVELIDNGGFSWWTSFHAFEAGLPLSFAVNNTFLPNDVLHFEWMSLFD